MNLYKQIKSTIPNKAKFPLWYLFKAPQRKINPQSLWNDLSGIVIFAWFQLFPKRELVPITICTGLKNRSENYLNQLLKSVQSAQSAELIELSIVDCGSTDNIDLKEAIRAEWPYSLVYTSIDRPFSRAYTFNKAVKQATHRIVFICDADMSIPANIVQLCNSYVSSKQVWFPIYFFLFKGKKAEVSIENGVWEQYGSKGMFAALKSDYLESGGLDEQYTEWGQEDTDLWERFHQLGFRVIRNKQKDFYHHWHTSFNPKYQHLND